MPLGFGGINTNTTYQGYTPGTILGVSDWFRADLGVKKSAGNVAGWQSQAGLQTNWNSVSGTITPAASASYNNQQVFTFATGAIIQKTSTAVINPPWTIIVVGNMTTITTTSNFPLFTSAGGTVQIGFDAAFAGEWYSYGGANQAGGTINTNPNIFIFNNAGSGNTSALYVNSSSVTTSTSTTQTGNIGTNPFVGDSAAFTGSIAELVIIVRSLTLAERQEFMKYAATRYGISAS
jgi:hypothetical protein